VGNYKILKRILLFISIFFLISQHFIGSSAWTQIDIKNEKLNDGVEHWYHQKSSDNKSWFLKQFERMSQVILSDDKHSAFGKSIAFLVGVSEYEYLSPQLPSVKNDLSDMRTLLLSKGGFDEVYVASDRIVNRDLIELYMKDKFPKFLNEQDRLLFYYSGHGGDTKGRTGYMQFSNAKPNSFYGQNVLAINDVKDWSNEIPIKHLLFIFDCCASGLAFSSKSGGDDCNRSIINTLSGNGSRTVLTAGTAEQKTYSVQGRKNSGNGIFTLAFMDIFKGDTGISGDCNMITISDIYAHIQKEISKFSGVHQKELTPRIWTLQEREYRGTFLFLNPNMQKLSLTILQAESLNIDTKGKVVDAFGIIRLTSYVEGDVYLDDKKVDHAQKGDVIEYYNKKAGSHNIKIVSQDNQIFSENVMVYNGRVTPVTIKPELTIIKKTKQTGTISIKAENISGKLFIDNIYIDYIENGETKISKNQSVGLHRIYIVGKDKSLTRKVEVVADKTVKVKVAPTISGVSISGGSMQ
jgi:hypothetical protein